MNRTTDGLHKRWFKLDLTKNFLMDMLVKHWKGLPREEVEPPPLKVFKRYVTMALRDTVYFWPW